MKLILGLPEDSHAASAVSAHDEVEFFGVEPTSVVIIHDAVRGVSKKTGAIGVTTDNNDFEVGGNGVEAEIWDAYKPEEEDE